MAIRIHQNDPVFFRILERKLPVGNRLKKAVCFLIVLALLAPVCGCGKAVSSAGTENGLLGAGGDSAPHEYEPSEPDAGPFPVSHEEEFGGVYIQIAIKDFNALGFDCGDSVDLVFSNGFALEDLPYYSGFYVEPGQPLLIAYPGYPYIKAAVNYGNDLWDTAGLLPGSTASVYLREKGKYLDIQEALDLHYFDERERYDSDEMFANFRAVEAGGLKHGVLLRSASPCDNQHRRAGYVDDLIEAAGVNCIVDLADNDAKIQRYIAADDFSSPYFLGLYEFGNVILLGLSMNYNSPQFQASLARGFSQMAGFSGPYLVHCTEGKDRTGFACMVLEALAGATYDEIAEDYMLTYANYYRVTKDSDPGKYAVIRDANIRPMVLSMIGDENADPETADLAAAASAYLKNCGMREAEIDALYHHLTD